jgi:methionine-rich copper-binding protein CopC
MLKNFMKVDRLLFLFVFFLFAADAFSQGDGIALAPARVELEMQPGTETTFVVNLDYRAAAGGAAKPARIVASLNDWGITPDGRVEFYKANTQRGSASSWIVYSPAETTVTPGKVHSIRVTISVPADAAPGDHLAALIVEERPDSIKLNQSARQVVVHYRMASVFYIKVGKLTRRGSLENLQAQATPKGIVITPTLKNEGNSLLRPTASLKILDAEGKPVAEQAEIEPLPVLANSSVSQVLLLEKELAPGVYTVKYRVDFQDGSRPTEGVTDLTVKEPEKKLVNVASNKPVN